MSYAFPPAGSVGVHRVLRFLKWLPRLGWEPVVLTPRNARSVNLQPSLGETVQGVPVLRTPAFEALNPGQAVDGSTPGAWMPGPLHAMLSRAWRAVAVPDGRLGWVPFAVAAGDRLLRAEPVDAIYVTGKPFSSFLIGRRLARRFGVPWLMDLRDLWTLNRREPMRNAWHRRLGARLERALVHDAAAVVVNTPGNREEFIAAYPDVDPEKFVTITNGFDASEFGAVCRPDDPFTVAYTGHFYAAKQTRPDGEIFETHSPEHLLRAVAQLLQRRPALRGRCRVVVAGPRCDLAARAAERLGISDHVRLEGWVSHARSLELQQTAHLVFAVLARGEQSRSWVPAKLYQYLGSGTPILALVPEGDAASIVRETGSGVVVPPDDVEAIASALERAYTAFRRGESWVVPDPAAVARYEARALTARLVSTLDRVTGRARLETPNEAA